MQKQALIRHPNTPCDAVRDIEIEIERRAETATARFCIRGDIAQLRWPAVQASQRRDELWRHTCCELFLRSKGERAYYEFNLAPSAAWAAYVFDDYRQGMRNAEVGEPTIRAAMQANEATLIATIALPSAPSLSLAVSCVIEESSGRVSYWALKHPGGKPDFHHIDGFVLELRA